MQYCTQKPCKLQTAVKLKRGHDLQLIADVSGANFSHHLLNLTQRIVKTQSRKIKIYLDFKF